MKINLQGTVGGFNYELLRTLSYQATGGAELGECLATASRIKEGNFESWIKEWIKIAERVMKLAEEYLQKGEITGGRDAFLRASNYFRTAEFYAPLEDPRRLNAWQRSRECFQRAATLFATPIEPVEIPFEGRYLPGYFVSGGEGTRPTLIAITGFDGSGEELYHLIGAAAAEHGWHCLMFEGPGQRGALYRNPGLVMRPDFEVPIHAVVDFVLKRPDVDWNRLAVIGYSMGGYFAVRAAAFEPRIRACIANPLGVDLGTSWASRIPAFMSNSPRKIDLLFSLLSKFKPEVRWGLDHARWAMGIRQPHELFGDHGWKQYQLWDTVDRMDSPLLVLAGEVEFTASKPLLQDILNYVNAVKSQVNFQVFAREEGGSMHCQIGALSRAHGAIFAWLERMINTETAKPEHQPRVEVPGALVSMVRKYYGDELAGAFEKLGIGWK